jgi:hypothetical protein
MLEWVMAVGPSLLLRLLERKERFQTVKDFTEWIYRLCEEGEPRRLHSAYHILLHYHGIAQWIRMEHHDRWHGRGDDFGLKNPGGLDLTKWAKAFPDEETWAASMLQLGWIGPEQSVRKLLRVPREA